MAGIWTFPCAALSGLFPGGSSIPGALPRASLFSPFRADRGGVERAVSFLLMRKMPWPLRLKSRIEYLVRNLEMVKLHANRLQLHLDQVEISFRSPSNVQLRRVLALEYAGSRTGPVERQQLFDRSGRSPARQESC
jgi:hypothetical protein